MLHNYSHYEERNKYEVEVLVIGTGAGGVVVGAELV